MSQKLMLKQAKTQQQAFDQAVSHKTLFRLLKTAELFAKGYDEEREFARFDISNIKKSEDELRIQLKRQIECFQNSFLCVFEIYGNYELPEDLNFEEICYYVNEWKSYVPNRQDKYLYDKIIEILQGKRNKWAEISVGSKNPSNNEMNEVVMGNTINFMLAHGHEMNDLEKEVSKGYEQNKKKFVLRANLQNKEKDSKHLRHANMDANKRVQGQDYPIQDDEKGFQKYH